MNDLVHDRYDLLCRALQASAGPDDPLARHEADLQSLETLVRQELLALARRASPNDFVDIYREFEEELRRFREFLAYPVLAGKTVVAFGGAFSAGKSSLINALLGEPILSVDVTPTTSLPTYVLAGETDAITAINLHHRCIALSDEEFASLTHEEKATYGSEVCRALRTAFVVRTRFPWKNLAFIDTPGYSGENRPGEEGDADIAASWLNTAHAIVWVITIKQGDIPQSDLDFLARLDPAKPKIVVATRADQVSEEDREAILARMKVTLSERNISVLGVLAISTRQKARALLQPLIARLETWNAAPKPPEFTSRFKRLFMRYRQGLDDERDTLLWRKYRLDQLQLLADDLAAPLVDDLAQDLSDQLARVGSASESIAQLERRFFTTLAKVERDVEGHLGGRGGTSPGDAHRATTGQRCSAAMEAMDAT